MNTPREGDLYKVITTNGKTFEIKYGYYEEYERDSPYGEPLPIYPDFKQNPEYTKDGKPFVTQMQSICGNGSSSFKEGFCADCKFFENADELIGVCKNPINKKNNTL